MSYYQHSNTLLLQIGDYVRKMPHGIAGKVLSYDEETGHVQVEWPHIEGAMLEYERDLERVSSPVLALDELPILEVWHCGSDVPSPNTTYEVLGKWQDIDDEMWTCRIVSDDGSEEIADCFAAYIRMDGSRTL